MVHLKAHWLYPGSPSDSTCSTFTSAYTPSPVADSNTMASSHPLLPPLSGSSKALFFNSPTESHMFHEHPTLQSSIRVTLESAGAGLLVSAVQNALDKSVSFREEARAGLPALPGRLLAQNSPEQRLTIQA